MDPVYLIWMFAIGALVGGGIIGAIFYRNLAPSMKVASNLQTELDQARQEMDSYKTSVNSHFDKTSALVNELTQDYVKVYKHLAEGAQDLGGNRDLTNVLEQHQGKVLISVDEEPKTQDTIVSELSADAQQPQDPPQETSELLDEAVTEENIADSSEAVAAEAMASESLAGQGAKREPVLNVVKSGPKHDDNVAETKTEEGKGDDGVEEILTTKADVQKETAPSLSA